MIVGQGLGAVRCLVQKQTTPVLQMQMLWMSCTYCWGTLQKVSQRNSGFPICRWPTHIGVLGVPVTISRDFQYIETFQVWYRAENITCILGSWNPSPEHFQAFVLWTRLSWTSLVKVNSAIALTSTENYASRSKVISTKLGCPVCIFSDGVHIF